MAPLREVQLQGLPRSAASEQLPQGSRGLCAALGADRRRPRAEVPRGTIADGEREERGCRDCGSPIRSRQAKPQHSKHGTNRHDILPATRVRAGSPLRKKLASGLNNCRLRARRCPGTGYHKNAARRELLGIRNPGVPRPAAGDGGAGVPRSGTRTGNCAGARDGAEAGVEYADRVRTGRGLPPSHWQDALGGGIGARLSGSATGNVPGW